MDKKNQDKKDGKEKGGKTSLSAQSVNIKRQNISIVRTENSSLTLSNNKVGLHYICAETILPAAEIRLTICGLTCIAHMQTFDDKALQHVGVQIMNYWITD